MMTKRVLRLVRPSNEETIAALECLLTNARNGEIRGLACCYLTKDGVDEVMFTGAYAAHPERAIGAGLRLSMRLTQAQDAQMPGAP